MKLFTKLTIIATVLVISLCLLYIVLRPPARLKHQYRVVERGLQREGLIPVVLQDTNIGNQLSNLALAIYDAHSRNKHSLNIQIKGKAKKIKLFEGLKKIQWNTQDIVGTCCPKIASESHCGDCFWEYGDHIFNVAIPLQKKFLPMLHPAESYELVVHFRCGDAPFDRNASYGFLLDSYYAEAVRILDASMSKKVVVLHCFNHFRPAPGSNVSEEQVERMVPLYLAHLISLMKRLCPYANVQHMCKSIDEDFATMVMANKFIACTSSMSRFAALLRRKKTVAVAPNPHVFKQGDTPMPRNITQLPFNKYALKHERVKDYKEVPNVLNLLSGG